MSTPHFVPGQRWVSDTEAELGLGIVVATAVRRVVLSFPATGEQRAYAADNAPLSRVIYPVGERVRRAGGGPVGLTAVAEQDGCVRYAGRDDAGNEVAFDEAELDSCVQFSRPQERLYAGQIDTPAAFDLRVETLVHQHRHRQSPAFGLLGPRVQLLGHQLYIAHEVARRCVPRVLLADEVGLGKTIEAGLILHHQLASGLASRVLVVVPENLVHQWLVEMLRRFNLRFTILDEAACAARSGTDGDNPFEGAQLAISSLGFLTGDPDRQAQARAATWDLLVVDEAHHLVWSPGEASAEYRCIEAVARATRGLLLLTATPEQLGSDGHFARLRLIDPDRYHDLQAFRDEQCGYRPIGVLVETLLAADAPERLARDGELAGELRRVLGDALPAALATGAGGQELATAIDTAIERLLDRHGTGRVLFRNTREAVRGFPERHLRPWPLAAPVLHAERARGASLEEQLQPETLLGDAWVTLDPRVAWLEAWANARRGDKALVICARADTAQALEEHLRVRRGIRSAVFHEGMPLIARDRAAAYFADEEDGARLLVCSEIGSEGRNFQMARHLVLFDLPLDPDVLEQRIGRLDRIGQQYAIEIHVPYFTASAQAGLLRWYHEGLDAFERPCPTGSALASRFGTRLRACLGEAGDSAAIETLIAQTRGAHEELLETLRVGRDRLLERHSCNPREAQAMVAAVDDAARAAELTAYLERACDFFGVEQQAHGTDSMILRPGDHLRCESLPGLPEDGATVTCDRGRALAREDMLFLTWEHPLVTGVMDMLLAGEHGNTAFCTLRTTALEPGTLLLEAIFVVHCPAPRALQIPRDLPQATVRVVVDGAGRELGATLSAARISQLAGRITLVTARALVRQARAEIAGLITAAERCANVQRDDVIAGAVHAVEHRHTREVERLRALGRVNPNIRAQDIADLEERVVRQRRHLQDAQLKLDAIRVLLTT